MCKDSVFSLTMQIFPEIIWLVPSKPLSLHRQVKLKHNGMNSIESNKGEIVMYQPDETIRLEVRMGEETVWLTQQQMADLFATDRSSIAKHIQNIYQTDELEKEPTCAKIAQVRQEGNRKVKRSLVYYNLDMIISVGYKVNSKRGTKFRQWANKVLKEYLLRGYVVNTRIAALEQHAAKQDIEIKELKDKVDFFVRSSLPPVEGIFYDGQIFDAYAHIVNPFPYHRRCGLRLWGLPEGCRQETLRLYPHARDLSTRLAESNKIKISCILLKVN